CRRSPSWAVMKAEVGTSVISGPVVIHSIHSYVIPGRRRSWIEFIRGRLGEPVLRDAHFVRSSAWGPCPEERAQRASRRAGSPGARGGRNDDCCYGALILGALLFLTPAETGQASVAGASWIRLPPYRALITRERSSACAISWSRPSIPPARPTRRSITW